MKTSLKILLAAAALSTASLSATAPVAAITAVKAAPARSLNFIPSPSLPSAAVCDRAVLYQPDVPPDVPHATQVPTIRLIGETANNAIQYLFGRSTWLCGDIRLFGPFGLNDGPMCA